jgi:DNA-binding protein H-NS
MQSCELERKTIQKDRWLGERRSASFTKRSVRFAQQQINHRKESMKVIMTYELVFTASMITEENGFFALKLETAGHAGLDKPARPAVCKPADGAQVASPQSPILR